MKFKDRLNDYIDTLGCRAKTLSEASGLSPTVISRYRNGERMPSSRSIQLNKLCHGISILAERASLSGITEENIYASFLETLNTETVNPLILGRNLSIIISLLEINKSELSRFLNYDPSYLSRICSGQRFPSNPDKFIQDVCKFIIHRYTRPSDLAVLASLLGCKADDLKDPYLYKEQLMIWFGSKNIISDDSSVLSGLLSSIDLFKSDKNPVSEENYTLISKAKDADFYFYSGEEGVKQSQLDFFAKNAEMKTPVSIYLYSDIIPAGFEKGPEYLSEWMMHLMYLQTHGFDIYVILNFEQAIYEIAHYFSMWLPIYASGKIHLYYISDSSRKVAENFICVSPYAVVSGEASSGPDKLGDAVYMTSQDAVDHYLRKIRIVLKHASPLMEIYKEEDLDEYHRFMNEDARQSGMRRNLIPSLSAFVLSDEELESLLDKTDTDKEKRELFLNEVRLHRERCQNILNQGNFHLEVPYYEKKDFEDDSKELYVDGPIRSIRVRYNFSDYWNHLGRIREYKETHPNFSYKLTSPVTFENLQIVLHSGHWVLIGKKNQPNIFFVIHHPKVRSAFENIVLSSALTAEEETHLADL